MKPIKEPIDNIRCPICERPYSFFRFRVTLQNPKREICGACGIEEEVSQRNTKTAEAV